MQAKPTTHIYNVIHMKPNLYCLFVLLGCSLHALGQADPIPLPIFDGKTFTGWQGDTVHTWRIENGTIIGGSVNQTVPHNDFLSTTASYGNFDLSLQCKLVGTGFVNAGVQFHSQRMVNPAYEMVGYQADVGDGYWASLYDESRRNVTIVKPDSLLIAKILRVNEWNDYRIRCEGRRIRIWLNGSQTVDYTEPDPTIVHTGVIAL